ncbi:MAG TPA: S1C family serine protease [Roseiarcus sp.]|jgi:S1-C subfamily serine protease
MVGKLRWEASPPEQSKPEEFGFDLNRALDSVVALQSEIPEDAFTAPVLGVKRAGSGVVIRGDGLVLTIGYLITEAESVWLTSSDGRLIPGHALAVDQETGFGLVQALEHVDLPALEIGRSSEALVGDPVVVAAGGRRQFMRGNIIGKHEFAGYWEYVLDEAIFTAPAHPFWGGAGLISSDGKLVGIGSLHIEQAADRGQRRDVNMVVPIDLLTPILDDLLKYGRANRPARPWLGVYCAESDDRVVIAGVADGGPADSAGLRRGDIIVAVDDAPVANLSEFYRKIWSRGSSGVEVPLTVNRDERGMRLRIQSTDRVSHFRKPRLH